MPRMGWILGFCAMASLGLPGLAGFWGEFPAILSAYERQRGQRRRCSAVYMVIAAIGTVLAAGYLLWLYQRTAFGTPTEEFADDPHLHDVTSPSGSPGCRCSSASSCSASSRTSSSTSPIRRSSTR